jgi:hypothetical protein
LGSAPFADASEVTQLMRHSLIVGAFIDQPVEVVSGILFSL